MSRGAIGDGCYWAYVAALFRAAQNATPTPTVTASPSPTVTPTVPTPPSGAIWRKYYFAGAQRVAMRVAGDPVPANNGVFYLLGDHLGSTSIVVNAAGTKIGELRYKAWGETRFSSGNLGTDYRYTGQREEAGFGLYYYRARWYDPLLGRFAQADTLVPGVAPIDLDRYSYARENPLRFADPSGMKVTECGPHGEECGSLASPWMFSGEEEIRFEARVRRVGLSRAAEILFLASLDDPLLGMQPSWVTTLFGKENTLGGKGWHPGVDFGIEVGAGDRGTYIFGIAFGTVVDIASDYDSESGLGLGTVVVVEHNVGGVRFYSLYAHLERALVAEGTTIDNTTVIGQMGSSGLADSMNVHLHLEVRTALNVKVDPSGRYQDIRRSPDSYWADDLAELHSKWFDLGQRYGYDPAYGNIPAD
jgi:RHS repeat-associated protein